MITLIYKVSVSKSQYSGSEKYINDLTHKMETANRKAIKHGYRVIHIEDEKRLCLKLMYMYSKGYSVKLDSVTNPITQYKYSLGNVTKSV